MNLTAKEQFNALQNARHIFALKEDDVSFKVVKLIPNAADNTLKAIIVTEDGEVSGLFTDSVSAISALTDLVSAFGDDCPMVKVSIIETKSGKSIYKLNVQ